MLRVISTKRIADATRAYMSTKTVRPPINPALKASKTAAGSASSSNMEGVNMSTSHGAVGDAGDSILDKALLFAGIGLIGWWWFCV